MLRDDAKINDKYLKEALEKFIVNYYPDLAPKAEMIAMHLIPAIKRSLDKDIQAELTVGEVFNEKMLDKVTAYIATLDEFKKLDSSNTAYAKIMEKAQDKEFIAEFKMISKEPDKEKKMHAFQNLLKKNDIDDATIHQFENERQQAEDKVFGKDSTPTPKPSTAETPAADPYINLFGILSSVHTGSHPVPIYCYIGNGLGFPDWNPHHGDAPIDHENLENTLTQGNVTGSHLKPTKGYSSSGG